MNMNSSLPRRILVTTDFSEASFSAFPFALHYAARSGTELELLTVVEEPIFPVPFGGELLSMPEIEDIERNATSKITQIGEQNLSAVSYRSTAVRYCGSPADAIIKHAQEKGIELIVIATQGHGLIGQIVLGSVSEGVMRGAPCPVLLVPCRTSQKPAVTRQPAVTRLPYNKIIVTSDFSEASESVMPIARAEAEHNRSQLELIYVVEELFAPGLLDLKESWDRTTVAEIQTRYRDQLHANLIKRAALLLPGASCRVLEKQPSVAITITNYSRERQADLLIMALHGGGRHKRMFGTIAERVARHMACPLLIVPPK